MDANDRVHRLCITRAAFNALVNEALRAAPAECCGLLAGRPPWATRLLPLSNELRSPTRYQADPRDLIKAFRLMRQERLELLAIYHSHPTTPAEPSRTDLAQNYYGALPHLIISLLSDPPEVRAFRLGSDSYEQVQLHVQE